MGLTPRPDESAAALWWVETVAAAMIALYGLVALFGGITLLISGDVPAGRAVAALVLLNGLVLVACAVVLLRIKRVRLLMGVLGLTLASLQASFDAWIFTSARGLVVDVWPLAVLASLAIAGLITRSSVPADVRRPAG